MVVEKLCREDNTRRILGGCSQTRTARRLGTPFERKFNPGVVGEKITGNPPRLKPSLVSLGRFELLPLLPQNHCTGAAKTSQQ
jgi:hypothetical protein